MDFTALLFGLDEEPLFVDLIVFPPLFGLDEELAGVGVGVGALDELAKTVLPTKVVVASKMAYILIAPRADNLFFLLSITSPFLTFCSNDTRVTVTHYSLVS